MKLTVNICDLDLSGEYYDIIDINFQKQPAEVLCEKSALRNFAKFAEKKPVPEPFLKKSFRQRLATLLQKRLWHRCFPVNFVKFLRIPFSQNTSERLLLIS